jgi:hypothetical protein
MSNTSKLVTVGMSSLDDLVADRKSYREGTVEDAKARNLTGMYNSTWAGIRANISAIRTDNAVKLAK